MLKAVGCIGIGCVVLSLCVWSAVAVAADNHIAFHLPSTIRAGTPYQYTVTGSVEAKGAQQIMILLYNQEPACPASFTGEHALPYFKARKPAKGLFSVGVFGEIGTNANSVSYTCAYVYAQEGSRRVQLAHAALKYKVAATGTGVTVTNS